MYTPKKDDIEYLNKLRKENKKTLNKSLCKETSMILACSLPLDLESQLQDTLGKNWFSKPEILAKFMRENPQYVVAKPL